VADHLGRDTGALRCYAGISVMETLPRYDGLPARAVAGVVLRRSRCAKPLLRAGLRPRPLCALFPSPPRQASWGYLPHKPPEQTYWKRQAVPRRVFKPCRFNFAVIARRLRPEAFSAWISRIQARPLGACSAAICEA